jgi:hypothetical protein
MSHARAPTVVVSLVIAVCLFEAPRLHADPDAQPSPDQFSVRFDFDSLFDSYVTATWTHTDRWGGSWYGSVVTYLDFKTVELDLGRNVALGGWTLSPALGTTMGPASWGLSTDTNQYLARDVVPQATIYYADDRFEGEEYLGAWIPIREHQATAVTFVQSEAWAVYKLSGLGVGPHLEMFGTKDGASRLVMSHLWVGAHLLKKWDKVTFQLFVGYDPISLSSYFGAPKHAGEVYRASLVYSL